MKKTTLLITLFAAGSLFAQHAQHKAQNNAKVSASADMMMSMHHPMMVQPFVTGVHPDISFLENMIPHHQGAIDSSKLMLKLTKNAEILGISKKIIASQEKEVADFQKLVSELKNEAKSLKGINIKKYDADAQKDMDAMMNQMSAVELTGDIARDFLSGMIIHHAGAVSSSKQVLKYTKDARIKSIADAIISAQDAEIQQFQKILAR